MHSMDRLRPEADAEPIVPAGRGAVALSAILYAALAASLLAGLWVRFNSSLMAVAPTLAGPAAGVAEQLASAERAKGLVELKLLGGHGEATQAMAAMQLSSNDLASLKAAIEQQKLRLVQLPLFDAGPMAGIAGLGRAVQVSAGGYTRLVHLTRQPMIVTLPISRVGTVTFEAAGAESVGIGAITLSGPVRLPDLPAGQVLQVGVIAQ